jgi:hypothetical protein
LNATIKEATALHKMNTTSVSDTNVLIYGLMYVLIYGLMYVLINGLMYVLINGLMYVFICVLGFMFNVCFDLC